jgi:hypothetical protein
MCARKGKEEKEVSAHFLSCLKAYTALAGVIATALLAQHTGGTAGTVLTDVAAVSTAVGVWAVPNKAPRTRKKAPSGPSQSTAE